MRMKQYWAAGVTIVAVVSITVALAGQAAKPAATPAGNGTLLDDLVVANRILANENILDGLGHVSVRSLQRPDHFFLSRDLAPGLVTAALAQALGNRTVALIRGHGAAIVGTTLPDAVQNAIFTDVNARVQAQAVALGGNISYLTLADVAGGDPNPQPSAPPGAPGYYTRSWLVWKAKAMGEKR